MTYKNQLQEHYQKLEEYKHTPLKKLLVYSDVRDNSTGLFFSTLTTPHGTFASKGKPRKVDAQTNAAKRAVLALEEVTPSQNVELEWPYEEVTVIVDVENYSDFLNRYREWTVSENINFVAVMSSSHPLAEKKWPAEIRKIVVHSTRKDAADTAIIMYLMNDMTARDMGEISNYVNYYLILTRDHFASNVRDVLSSVEFPLTPDIDSERYDVRHVLTYEDLYRQLSRVY